MSTQGRCAADLYQMHDFQMLRRQRMILAILFAVKAKDIRQLPSRFSLWSSNRSLWADLSGSCKMDHVLPTFIV
jgi:hypothetical protein